MSEAEPPGPTAGPYGYDVTAEVDAPLEQVWGWLAGAERWKEWSFLTRSFRLRDGEGDPDGVGALRRFAVGPFGSVEEVVDFDPPHHLGYVAHKGMPARRYRADVWLTAAGTRTQVHWVGSLTPLVPGIGPLVAAYARSFIRRFVGGLQAYARAR